MARPIVCDGCGATIEVPFISVQGQGIRIKADTQEDLCKDCVFERIKLILGIDEIVDPDAITEEVYGVEA